MRNPILRTLALAGALGIASAASGQDFVQVYFSVAEQSTPESAGNAPFEVRLSRSSALEIVVPIFIDQEQSTAVSASGSTETDGDYYITEDPEAGFDWDYEARRGTITFAPGETSHSVPIRVINDRAVEGDEQIVFRVDAANVTVARPVEPSALIYRILDNDPVAVHFNGLEYTAVEGSAFSIDLITSSASTAPINVVFEATPATQAGLDRNNSEWPTGNTFQIPAGADRRSFSLPTTYDAAINDTRHFDLRLVSAREEGASEDLPVDQRVARLSLLDSGPLEVGFNVGTNDETPSDGRTIAEYGSHGVAIALSAAQDQDVIIPISFGGSAVRGDNDANRDTYDYRTNVSAENTLTITEGNRSVTLQVSVGGRARPAPGATIVAQLGTPRLEDGAELPLGSSASYTFTIANNAETTLSFGHPNPDYDSSAPDEEPPFLPSGGFVAARSDGFVQIPIFLSNAHGQRTDFEVEIVSEGTNAVLFTGTEEDWDFYLNNSQGGRLNATMDSPIAVTIPPGNVASNIPLTINSAQDDVTYPWTRDPDSDRTVRLRISEVNTDVSRTTIGQSEFVLTIREFPDIDVTHLFLEPVPSAVPPLNTQTSLHELDFDFDLAGAAPDPAGLEGYRTYKVVFQPGVFNAENRDDPENDPLSRFVLDSAGATYHLDVTAPFRPRYPSSVSHEVLIQGQPRSGATFRDEHANVRLPEYAFFRHLDLPPLDPARGQETHPDGRPLDEDFSFRIEFTSGGSDDSDLARLAREGAVRVYLSRSVPPAVSSGTILGNNNILRFLPREDGSVFIEVHNPDGQSINVQYLDADGRWRNAQAPALRNLGTRLLWIDHGPPRTHRHPSEVDFRLYRFSITN